MQNRRRNVLIGAEHCDDTETLELLFEGKGFTIMRAYEGDKIIERLTAEDVAVIFLQDFLQGISGLEICRRIRAKEKLADIPIYIISEDASQHSRRDITDAGADGVILRPFDQGEVWRRVEKKLESRATERRLKAALASIDGLSNFGESLLEVFNPLKYDWLGNMDLIVHEILGGLGNFPGRPGQILLGWYTKGIWKWLLYEAPFGRSQRNELSLTPQETESLLEGRDSFFFFANNEEWQCDHAIALKKILENRYLAVQNLVAYRNRRLCVFAVNYGEPVSNIEALVLKSLATQGLFLVSLSDQIQATEDAFIYTVRSLARVAEMNDDDTGNHVLRVGRYSAFLAEKLGLPESFVKSMAVAAQIHDVGKVKLGPEILRKPTSLSPAEWELNRRHPQWGAEIIGLHPRLAMARLIALSHHEKWDGSGYPQGLKGNAIPLEGRIVAIADAYDALRNRRAYKRSYQHKEVKWIMTKGDGRTKPDHFDPVILDIFTENHEWFAWLYEELGDAKTPEVF